MVKTYFFFCQFLVGKIIEHISGPRGIAALESYFERVKFKGKGHEHQDLNVIMKTYEYWCHRLFPKFPFDTCIERLEKLGTKKPVQVPTNCS